MLKSIPPHLRVALTGWGGRLTTVAVQLVSMRILLAGLGTERYAAYLLLAGLAAWYGLMDFGLGASLQNFVGEQRAKSESYSLYIRAVASLVIPMLILVIGGLYMIAPYLAPMYLRHVESLAPDEKVHIFFLTGVIFAASTVGSIVYKLWYAERRGYLANLLPPVASVLGLAGIWLVLNCGVKSKLLACLLAFNLPLALLSLTALVYTLNSAKSGDRVGIVLLPMLLRALKFWVFALMTAATVQVDYLIMSQFLSAQEVVIYSITTRIFGIGAFVFSALLAALWPMFTEFMVQRRWDEIRKAIKRNLAVGMVGMMALTVIVTFSMPWILKLIAPRDSTLIIPTSFILLVGAYQLVLIWISMFSTLLQSASLMRVFLLWTPVQMTISVAGQWCFAQCYGVYGIIMGLLLSYLVLPVWFLPRTLRAHMQMPAA